MWCQQSQALSLSLDYARLVVPVLAVVKDLISRVEALEAAAEAANEYPHRDEYPHNDQGGLAHSWRHSLAHEDPVRRGQYDLAHSRRQPAHAICCKAAQACRRAMQRATPKQH